MNNEKDNFVGIVTAGLGVGTQVAKIFGSKKAKEKAEEQKKQAIASENLNTYVTSKNQALQYYNQQSKNLDEAEKEKSTSKFIFFGVGGLVLILLMILIFKK